MLKARDTGARRGRDGLIGRVVTADGQILCSGEKMSKGASKARAQLARMTGSPALLERGRELITPSSAFFVPRAERAAFSC